jgi:hypothetical protein
VDKKVIPKVKNWCRQKKLWKGFQTLFLLFFLLIGSRNFTHGLWQQHGRKMKGRTKPNSTQMGTAAEKQQQLVARQGWWWQKYMSWWWKYVVERGCKHAVVA